MDLTAEALKVQTLGECRFPSPLGCFDYGHDPFVSDEAAVRFQIELFPGRQRRDDLAFERSGPRRLVYFDPNEVRAAVVTCGGLSPGLNNVIRSIFLELTNNYGVRDILGIRYGFSGFSPDAAYPPLKLTSAVVDDVHLHGGSFLGCSRGAVPPAVILDFLERERIQILFCLGGDGTQRGASAVYQEAARRGYPLAVVGIPKTIDNDVPFVWRTFGFLTALEKATEIIIAAKTEARNALNGISIVKLMGREAGFIAANSALASQLVDVVLVPEIPFKLEGENGLLSYIGQKLRQRGHLVIVVAEGAGQDLFDSPSEERDASGNVRFHDVGLFLKDKISDHFAHEGKKVNLRYFDPSYFIRSVTANCEDSLVCDAFGRHAAHAAMAGKTNLVIGRWYNILTHVPIPLITAEKKRMSPASELWRSVLQTTNQPGRFS